MYINVSPADLRLEHISSREVHKSPSFAPTWNLYNKQINQGKSVRDYRKLLSLVRIHLDQRQNPGHPRPPRSGNDHWPSIASTPHGGGGTAAPAKNRSNSSGSNYSKGGKRKRKKKKKKRRKKRKVACAFIAPAPPPTVISNTYSPLD